MKTEHYIYRYRPHRRPVRREPPLWAYIVAGILFLGLIFGTITVAEAACRAMGCGA